MAHEALKVTPNFLRLLDCVIREVERNKDDPNTEDPDYHERRLGAMTISAATLGEKSFPIWFNLEDGTEVEVLRLGSIGFTDQHNEEVNFLLADGRAIRTVSGSSVARFLHDDEIGTVADRVTE